MTTATATSTTTAAVRPLIISLLFLSLQTTSLSLRVEGDHLIQFKASLKDSSSLDPTWLAGTDPCARDRPWLGIHCSDTTVSSLLLMNLGLSNKEQTTIDVVPLEKLENLRFVSLENNSFSGPIPEFNRLSSLKSLFLSGNGFSGEIPSGFFTHMGSLKKLELYTNNFSGKIPGSLQQLDSLIEILLQRNRFSGPFPILDQASLKVLDLSFNNLEGEIPHSMQRQFPASAFEGNPGACGVAINKPCKAMANTLPPLGGAIMMASATTKWVVLAIVVAVLVVTILFKKKDKSDMFSMIGRDPSMHSHHEHAVEVHAPSINRRGVGSSRRVGNHSENGSKKAHSNHGKSSDLVMINEENGMFGMSDLMKAAAEVLGNSGMGSSYKATMANYAMPVVAKRMRGMNKLHKDAFDVEIRRLGRIRHRNILPPLAYHYRKEEKLLVTEFVPKGSLMFVLHGDGGIAHAELDWPTRLKIIKGIARGMGFLHTELSELELPHGNLKSSNILLSSNHEPLLTDYSLHSLSSSAQSLQGYKSPEVVLHQQITPKSDVYCLGVVILEVMTGKYPSQYHNNGNGTDLVKLAKEAVLADGKAAELIDPEIVKGGGDVAEMEKMVCIGAACVEEDHEARMEMREAIRSIEAVQL